MVHVNDQTKYYWQKFDQKVAEFNLSKQLPDYFGPMIGDKKKVRIAELGCALVNTIGDSWPDVDVEIVCSDKYAHLYQDMWRAKKMHPLHPIETQDMENLRYDDNSFDIVHCRNALDHTEDAIQAVKEMQRVTREWVYLLHAESQKKIYGGHHFHNIEDLDLAPLGFTTVQNGKWIISKWQKK